jgi:hypothetical protein
VRTPWSSFDWLTKTNLDMLPIEHPAGKQALADLLARLESDTDVAYGVSGDGLTQVEIEVYAAARRLRGTGKEGVTMKRWVTRAVVALTASVGLSGAVVATASAAPTNAKNASPISISCDNNQTYSAVVNSGNSSHQSFSPAHDLNSTSVLVPTAFGVGTSTLTNSSNQVVDTQTTPPATKGNSQGGGTPLNCSYSLSFTPVSDPDCLQRSPRCSE